MAYSKTKAAKSQILYIIFSIFALQIIGSLFWCATLFTLVLMEAINIYRI